MLPTSISLLNSGMAGTYGEAPDQQRTVRLFDGGRNARDLEVVGREGRDHPFIGAGWQRDGLLAGGGGDLGNTGREGRSVGPELLQVDRAGAGRQGFDPVQPAAQLERPERAGCLVDIDDAVDAVEYRAVGRNARQENDQQHRGKTFHGFMAPEACWSAAFTADRSSESEVNFEVSKETVRSPDADAPRA